MAGNPIIKRARDSRDDAEEDQRQVKRIVVINDFDNTITVLVGKEEKPFILHQDAVCAKSKFFRAACSRQWREGQDKLVRLPEAKSTIFKEYCGWVYSGEIAEHTGTEQDDTPEKSSGDKRLIDIYALGDTLDDIALRNHVLSMFFVRMRNHKFLPNVNTLRHVWKSTPQGSPMRKMIVDVIVSVLRRQDFATKVSIYPSELVQEIAVAALAVAPIRGMDYIAEKVDQYREVEKAD